MPKKEASPDLTVAAWISMFAILVGWFLLDTLVVTVGPLAHGVRFYDLSAAIVDPPGVLFGLNNDHMFNSIVFGLLACTPGHLRRSWGEFSRRALRAAAYFAPLGLMVVCAIALYFRTSGDFLPAPEASHTVGGDLVRLANDLLNRGAGVVANRVAVGAGGYLAAAGSLWLALLKARGTLRP